MSDRNWDADLIDVEVRIWTDDRAGAIINTLTGEVAPEPAFLALEALSEAL